MEPIGQERFVIGNYQYLRYPLHYFFDTAERLGYQYVELWAAGPSLYPEALDAGKRRSIKKELARRGLKAYNMVPELVVYPFNAAASDNVIRRMTIAYFKSVLELASDLEAPYMMISAGCGYFNEPAQEAWKRSQDTAIAIDAYARELGIGLFYETLTPPSSNVLNTPRQLAEMLASLSGNVNGMIDFGQAAFMGQKLEDYFDALGKRLSHVHLQDCGEAVHMALGEGRLPIGEWIEKIENTGYAGKYTLEINDVRYRKEPVESDEKSYHYLVDRGIMAPVKKGEKK